MEEKSNIELLRDFAKASHRTIEDKETQYPVAGSGRIPQFRRTVFMPNNSKKTSFFIWFSDPYVKIGLPTIYCGAFIPMSSRIKASFHIRAKNVVDKLNVFSKSKVNRVGNERFDAKVVIGGHFDEAAKRLLSPHRIQSQILAALELAPYMKISINENNVDFVPELKNHSYLSIINPQSWEFDADTIENWFTTIENIRTQIA